MPKYKTYPPDPWNQVMTTVEVDLRAFRLAYLDICRMKKQLDTLQCRIGDIQGLLQGYLRASDKDELLEVLKKDGE